MRARQELMAAVSEQASPRHRGQEITQSSLAKAQHIAQEELAALGWNTRELRGHRKSDPQRSELLPGCAARRQRCWSGLPTDYVWGRRHT